MENRYSETQISGDVPHVWHTPKKHGPPLTTPDADKPWEKHGLGETGVVYYSRAKLHRHCYQVRNRQAGPSEGT